MNPTSLQYYMSKHAFKPTAGTDGKPFGIVTCPVRLAFTYFEADKMRTKQNGKKCFSAILIVPPTADIGPLKSELARVAKDRWGDAAPAMAQTGVLKFCLKPQLRMQKRDKVSKVPLTNADGTPMMPKGFGTDGVFIETESQFTWAFWDEKRQAIPSTRFYAGCWALAHLRLWAYPRPGQTMSNQGVGASIVDLQFLADDEKFGGDGKSDGRAMGVIEHAPGMSAPAATASAPSAPTGPAQAPNPASVF